MIRIPQALAESQPDIALGISLRSIKIAKMIGLSENRVLYYYQVTDNEIANFKIRRKGKKQNEK